MRFLNAYLLRIAAPAFAGAAIACAPLFALADTQTFTAAGTFTSPISGSVTFRIIGGGGGGGGGSWEDGYAGGSGGSGAPSSVSGSFGTITAAGGAAGAGQPTGYVFGGSLHCCTSGAQAGQHGADVSQTISLTAGQAVQIAIGGGGGGGGGGGTGTYTSDGTSAGYGPSSSGGAAGSPGAPGDGGMGGFSCAWSPTSGHSGPAYSSSRGGTSMGGGGGGGAASDDGSWGCAAGGNGGMGSASAGGTGGTVRAWVGIGAAGGSTPGAGGEAGRYGGGGGGGGAPGIVYVSWVATPATCSVSLTPAAVNRGSSATLSWSAQNADWVYINNIGYVNSSGSTTVSPAVTTDYSCYASGGGGSDGWHAASLTVYQPCAFAGGSVANGGSVAAYQAATVPYGTSCVSQTRTCSDGTLSGTYAYGSCAVSPGASCVLDGATVEHGSTYTFYSARIPPSGMTCSSVSQARTCDNGVLSGTDTYAYSSCTCAPFYSCSGNTITYTNGSCAVSTVASCTAPSYCSAGVSSCVDPEPSFGANGHLRASPLVVPPGISTRLFWNVTNVRSCSVSGGGQSWTGASSPAGGQQTAPISARTIYTLSCLALAGATQSTVSESVTVNVLPVFQEN